MSRNTLTQARRSDYPAAPAGDWDWRDAYPRGSLVRIAEYETETGWHWKSYRVIEYYPFVVLCEDRSGFRRCFGNWEFRKRQTGKVDGISGRPVPRDMIRTGDG